VTLARRVPQLEFVAVLLGDEPALEPSVTLYQRLLARDQDEALDLIIEHSRAHGPELVYDELLVPALCALKQSWSHGDIDPDDAQFVLQEIREIVDEVQGMSSPAAEEPGDSASVAPAEAPIAFFGCPARDDADRVALEMLQGLLDPGRWKLEVMTQHTLTAELLDRVAERRPALACIAALPPGGLAHTRYLCKRLDARFPDLRIIVGRFGLGAQTGENAASFSDASTVRTATSLLEARRQLMTLLPVLVHERDRAHSARPGEPCLASEQETLARRPDRRAVEEDREQGTVLVR
jgi:hypothetical protein